MAQKQRTGGVRRAVELARSLAGFARKLAGGARRLALALPAVALALVLAACSMGAPKSAGPSDLSAFPPADLSSFTNLDESASTQFVGVNMQDVAQLIQDDASFVLYCAYGKCPWCQAITPVVWEVAAERGEKVCLLDTRKDPSWVSNMDIDNYELFVHYFGEWLEDDENGDPHLYVPFLVVVSQGQVAAVHSGVIEGYDDNSQPLTDEQHAELVELLNSLFELMEAE